MGRVKDILIELGEETERIADDIYSGNLEQAAKQLNLLLSAVNLLNTQGEK